MHILAEATLKFPAFWMTQANTTECMLEMDEVGGCQEEIISEPNTQGKEVLIGGSGAGKKRSRPVEVEKPSIVTEISTKVGNSEVGVAPSLGKVTELSGEDQLDSHPFWQLLLAAGYTVW